MGWFTRSKPVLSSETQRRLDILFNPQDRQEAGRLLAEQCGNNLPFSEKLDALALERFRFAALKLSGGHLDQLREAIELAKRDRRDLLIAAGFANNPHDYKHWEPKRSE
jgi:hypothetical protein